MRGSSDRKTKKEKKVEIDEVEQLLQATQDQFLLNLTLNSHITRYSPSPSSSLFPSNNNNHDDDDIHLDLDLERRFQALKRKSPAQDNSSKDEDLNSVVLGEDLVARFSALKGKSSSSQVPLGVGPTASNGGCGYEEESEDEEDQVQKLIEWAKDAARLDPSPPSDDDDDNSSSASDDADNDNRRKQK